MRFFGFRNPRKKKIRCKADLENRSQKKVMARKGEETQRIPLAPLIRGSRIFATIKNKLRRKIFFVFNLESKKIA